MIQLRSFLLILFMGLFASPAFSAPAATLVSAPEFRKDSSQMLIEKELGLIISRALSPNGDGVNDYWHIQGIEKISDNRVFIFNRWGDKICVIKNYDNQSNRWDGKDDNGNTLPDGTYYFLMEVKKLGKSLNGWIYLIN